MKWLVYSFVFPNYTPHFNQEYLLRKKKQSFFKKIGPGIITGVSDDDPSGIATYTQAGAQFGLTTLWAAIITFPLMLAIQEMCGRIGLVTSEGLTNILLKHYSKILLYFIIFLTVPAIIFNIAADIAAMGAVANLMFPKIPTNLYSILFTILLIILLTFFSYKKIVSVLKYLCLSILLYIAIPFFSSVDWKDTLKNTFIPTIHFNKEFFSVLIAILGTTISPYL
ncbi:MAG: Nramp family divalent metal transporter, partial [Legionella longbeachae]|nr:Nramp family divalent metal transporter [Legionella longbeachae]